MAAKEKRTQSQLAPSEAAVSDVVGRLIEFWGFKRNMGRIWAVLYLSPEPLRGKRNEPANIVHTARVVAAARATAFDDFAALERAIATNEEKQ